MKQAIAIMIICLFLSSSLNGISISTEETIIKTINNNIGPMDSPWPMHGHDIQSTGRSPYDSKATTNFEKWRIYINNWAAGGAVIDNNGIIYYCDHSGILYAINPDGSERWRIDVDDYSTCDFGNTPAIDENGVIYIGGWNEGLTAVASNGTILWRIGWGVESSPVIGSDGTIYCSFAEEDNWRDPWYGVLRAINPDGTIKWTFKAGNVIQSSPAIGNDGNIIFGSHDDYVYSLYPNNGTIKWKYNTGSWVHGSPSIGSDGTIYIGSDNGYLYALNPNTGVLLWELKTGSMRSSPSIDKEGTLYYGTTSEQFCAVYNNGTIKWRFSPKKYSGTWGPTAVISNNNIVYFAFDVRDFYPDGAWIFAFDLNGNELWRKTIANDWISSSPCIGPDGTVYIGSINSKFINSDGNVEFMGYLHAFGPVSENSPPNKPVFNGDTSGIAGRDSYFQGSVYDPDRNPVCFSIDWGDGTISDWYGGGWRNWKFNECASNETVQFKHRYLFDGIYSITIKARDSVERESEPTTHQISIQYSWTKANLFGTIKNKKNQQDTITFNANKIIYQKNKFRFYNSGESFLISKESSGFIGNRFIAGEFKIGYII